MTNKIDFSKAPEGATHYYFDTDNELFWYKSDEYNLYVFAPTATDWDISWNKIDWLKTMAVEIPKQLTVTCKTDREVMLCEQVLRILRGEGGQYKDFDGNWRDINKAADHFGINCEYRAKPKKELFVPWDWVDDRIDEIHVNEYGRILDKHCNPLPFKLDLSGIEVPVTVKRPEVK